MRQSSSRVELKQADVPTTGRGPSCDHAGHAALWDTRGTLKYQLSILAKRKFLCSWILVKMRKLTRGPLITTYLLCPLQNRQCLL